MTARGLTLSEAIAARARQLAEKAPPMSAEVRERVRLILAGALETARAAETERKAS